MPSTIPKPSLAEYFASFLSDKFSSLILKLSCNPSPMPPYFNPPLTIKVLSSFAPASINEIAKFVHDSPNKQCYLDPIPIFLLKQDSVTILSIILCKGNCAKSSCFAIGKGHVFDISNMQLGNDSISWSSSFKYLGVSFIAGKKLSADIDVLRRKFVSACNCIFGNTKYQNEILKLTLQESYTLPLLQYGAMALRFCKVSIRGSQCLLESGLSQDIWLQ